MTVRTSPKGAFFFYGKYAAAFAFSITNCYDQAPYVGLFDVAKKRVKMQSVSQLVTSNKRLNKLVTSNELTSYQVKTRALGLAEGLTSLTEPNDMTAWYCLAFRRLGEARYSALASMARSGRNPRSLFGWLIKQELGKLSK